MQVACLVNCVLHELRRQLQRRTIGSLIMASSMAKAWFTSLRSSCDHGGGASSARNTPAEIAPAATCKHESCIAARIAVGQSRNAVATVVRSAEVRRGVLGGRAAGVLQRVESAKNCSVFTPKTDEGYISGGENGKRGIRAQRDRSTSEGDNRFRVILLNAAHITRAYVEEVLPMAVPMVTVDRAGLYWLEARLLGECVVTVDVEEYAEMYKGNMISYGLKAKIERDDTNF